MSGEEEGQDLKGGSFSAWLNEDNGHVEGDSGEGSLTRAMEAMDLNTYTPDDEDYLNLMANRIQSTWYENVAEFEGTLPPPETFNIQDDLETGYKTPTTNEGSSQLATPVTEPVKKSKDGGGFFTPEGGEGDELDAFNRAFEKHLHITEEKEKDATEKTLIILSPLSYKHVFSRLWYPKRYLSSVVERPERLMACAVGIAAAKVAMPTEYSLDTSTRRSKLTSRHVRRVHGSNWGKRLYELCENSREKLSKKEVEVPDDWHSGDIYLTTGTIEALEGVVGAVESAVERLFDPLDSDRIFLTIRPPGHHSHPCVPSGFCLINNAHIAIQYAAIHYNITHAVILDFDLHHGDGSQDICWKLAGFTDDQHPDDNMGGPDSDHEEKQATTSPRKRSTRSRTKEPQETDKPKLPKLGYFSLHDINSFPTEVGYASAENIKNASVCLMAHNMCIWNVHLEQCDDPAKFDQLYETKYKVLFDKAQTFLEQGRKTSKEQFRPMVILSAGFDASEYENVNMQRHAVTVPTKFYNRFTRDAMDVAQRYAGGRVLSLLEGGYSDAALSTGVFSHLTGLANAPWNEDWSNKTLAKEFEKGCKLKYIPPSTQTWISQSVMLGRSLWPYEVKEQAIAASTNTKSSTKTVDSLATPSRALRDRNKRTV
ncbi:hypothetical protein TRICI_000842 [Trichomonascus ciferrii]|uniref:Histone deacetylase domain-containing protein n=1 Tax=Trichomonascus ciferrii TaxID=44093 RepID=A0A642VA41_9ASCO|nr:hypothetical protein TRICI_000842 [Trichomonascus ciferrii]